MSPRNNLSLGKLGEDAAEEYLKDQGFTIIERNFKKPHGDIDIVARDGETLVFVEVKTRISSLYGSPEEAITPWKIRSLVRSAQYYRHIHSELPDCPMRIDAVTVSLTPDEKIEKMTLYKNITG